MRCGEPGRALALALLLACTALRAGEPLPATVEPGDRLEGVAHSGGVRGGMRLDLLQVDGEQVTAALSFSGGLQGVAQLRGRVARGAVYLNGLLEDRGTSHELALQAQLREDGGLAGIYELSERGSARRRTGSFNLSAVDARPPP